MTENHEGRRIGDEGQPPRRRENDQIIPRIEQKLDDLIMDFRTHRDWGEGVVKDHDVRLKALEKINQYVTAIGWCVVTLVGGILIWLGSAVCEWIKNHLK